MRNCVRLFLFSRVGESNCKVQHVLLLLCKGIWDLLIPLRVHYQMTCGTRESALACTCWHEYRAISMCTSNLIPRTSLGTRPIIVSSA